MRKSKKQERATQKILEMMKQAGYSEESLAEIKSEVREGRDAVSLQAEAVLLSLEKPGRFTTKKCKRCGEPFGTNYLYMSYCSDSCRAKKLAEIGIQWMPHKDPRERWGSPYMRREQPLVIPPEALKALGQILDRQVQIPEPTQTPAPASNVPASEQLKDQSVDEPQTSPDPSPAELGFSLHLDGVDFSLT